MAVSLIALILQLVALALCGLTRAIPRRLPVPRAVSALAAFAAGWMSLFLVATKHGPAWMVASGAVCVALSLAATVMAFMPEPGQDPPAEGGGPGYRPQVPPPDGPYEPDPGSGDPQWWPQFERELADYVAAQQRARYSRRSARAAAVSAEGTTMTGRAAC